MLRRAVGRLRGQGRGGKHLADRNAVGRPQGRGPIGGSVYPVRVNPNAPRVRPGTRVPSPTRGVGTAGMISNPIERVPTTGMIPTGANSGFRGRRPMRRAGGRGVGGPGVLPPRLGPPTPPRQPGSGFRGRRPMRRAGGRGVGGPGVRSPIHGPPAPPPKNKTGFAQRGKDTARWVRQNPGKSALGVGAAYGVGHLSNRSGRGTDKTNYAASRGVYGY